MGTQWYTVDKNISTIAAYVARDSHPPAGILDRYLFVHGRELNTHFQASLNKSHNPDWFYKQLEESFKWTVKKDDSSEYRRLWRDDRSKRKIWYKVSNKYWAKLTKKRQLTLHGMQVDAILEIKSTRPNVGRCTECNGSGSIPFFFDLLSSTCDDCDRGIPKGRTAHLDAELHG